LFELPPLIPDAKFLEEITRCDEQLVHCLTKIIENRHKNPKPDLITDLVQSHTNNHPETGDIVKQFIETIALAIIQPMPHLLGRAVIQLGHDSKLLRTLIDDPQYIPNFVDELMRRDSPVHFIPRRTSRSVTLSGVTIPTGSPVALLVASANHDPSQFPNPEQFDISRNNINHQLSFGAGIHRCTGAPLAKIQLVIVLEELLKRFQYIGCPESNELPWFYSFITHGVKDLPVTLQ
jgi:cytochrome P450